MYIGPEFPTEKRYDLTGNPVKVLIQYCDDHGIVLTDTQRENLKRLEEYMDQEVGDGRHMAEVEIEL